MNEVLTSFIATLLSKKHVVRKRSESLCLLKLVTKKLKICDHKWRKNKACLCSSGSVGLFNRFS